LTEVPEHLLRRAKERRSAMTGESASEAGAPATDAASKAVEPAASATPAPAGGGGAAVPPAAPVPPPYTGPPPAPPRKQRVPAWAMPVLVALPLWAVLYGGAFGEREVAAEGPLATGATVYRSAGCSGCHGPTGGGGVGPAMDGVLETFPDFADHVSWIRTGSTPFRGQPYGATGKIATGGMPGNESLSDEEVIAVVCHERITLGGGEMTPECEEGASPEGGGAGGAGGEADSASAES
jgi:mono/diheme cytochrome c family protein